MDPTTDPTHERSLDPPGAPPPPDLAGVLARMERTEQRLDALEWNQRALIAYLPLRFRPTQGTPLRQVVPPPTGPLAAQPMPRAPQPAEPLAPVPAATAASIAPEPVSMPAPALAAAAAVEPAPAPASLAESESESEPEPEPDTWTIVPGTSHGQAPSEPSGPSFTLPDLASLSPGRLLAWVGGAALVLGAVFFLSLAFSRGWITEPMRVMIGLISGVALMGASVVTFDRRGPVVAHVLAAAGIAILELSLYAARLFNLLPAELALLGAGIVAAAAMVIAIRFDSQPVAALGLLAVLAAPPIMSAPATFVTVAFLLLVLVAAAVVAVARGWRWLPWLAFAVTLPQLASWIWGTDVVFLITGPAILAWWAVFAGAALAESWRRPVSLRTDASALLLGLADVVAMPLLLLAGDSFKAIGVSYLVLGAIHVGLAVPFLRLRGVRDEHGQLLVGIAGPWLAVGIIAAVPDLLVPIALAGLAAGMGAVAARWSHRVALVEGIVAAGLATAWLLLISFPLTSMVTSFPPVGLQGQDRLQSTLQVAGMLAVIGAAARWSVGSQLGRSSVLAAGVVLGAWVIPFAIGGLWLIAAWTALAVATVLLAIRFCNVRLTRLTLPGDPLVLIAAVVGLVATAWGIAGFARPEGIVDLLSPVVTDRIVASLVPVAGLAALIMGLRPRWWRGAMAATALVLLTLGVWLVAGDASLLVAGLGPIEGSLIVLVGWSALALLALVLDERPRLRLASVPLLTRDPAGHPFALTALVPSAMVLLWLWRSFLVPGQAAGLPATPFLDETTLATGLVIGFLLAGAAVALTRLVRTVLVVTAVVLLAVLLPLELSLELAVLGWSVMAALTMVAGRRLVGPFAITARVLAGGLIAVGVGATLLVIAPPDRLVLELTRVPPLSGPPNAATLAALAVAGALAVAAWCSRGVVRWVPWIWMGAAGAVGWAISIGIADAFAVRMPGAADPTEVARQAQVALSIAWAAMGLGTLLVGLARDIALARQAGLVLLAIATVKVFVYDLATLDIAYRVLSLVGLGLLLLVSAWFYVHARHHGGPEPLGG